MPHTITYARFGGIGTGFRIHQWTDAPVDMLIYDVHGELGPSSLRDRLLALEIPPPPPVVVLRGISPFIREEILVGTGITDLSEFFPQSSVFELVVSDRIELLPVYTPEVESKVATPDLALIREAEVLALLVWSDAIWSDRNYHFVVPSGQHADKFVRFGDLFVEPVNITRLSDWCLGFLSTSCVLIADTFSLLPLIQELRFRAITLSPSCELRWHLLPMYGISNEEIEERLSDIIPWAREHAAPLISLVSVTASGGYVRRLQEEVSRFLDAPELITTILCQVGGTRDERALAYVPGKHFADAVHCELCSGSNSKPIEIDQRRFTTWVGSKVLDLPKPTTMEEHVPVIADLDRQGAFRLHVDRPDRHGHLSIFIDTSRLLTSRVFRAKATIGLARCHVGFVPDLVLVPEHADSGLICEWLKEEGTTGALHLPIGGVMPEATRKRIAEAHSILICDDSIITARTMRAALEIVQGIKTQVQDLNFAFRAFVLVARPASPETWKGLSDRFFIGRQRCLFAAWEINLPDRGYGSRDDCPWCTELRILENAQPKAPPSARSYLDSRIARLTERIGLESAIYLGAEQNETPATWLTGTHTSPGSYLGNISDVAAYVASAALLQTMRNEWGASIERWSMQYIIPLHQALERFTDPVIAAALLRGIRRLEVRGTEVTSRLTEILLEIDHGQQHPVLAAEILFAAAQDKLPHTSEMEKFREYLVKLPEDARHAINALTADPSGVGVEHGA
ncbi:MAG TPA: hypothetical protein VFE05_05315 [Longimicrobiaceae bacterium]|jgi:hypothetical protein|nr:hypothetical protein [Longimicrobiaceae bacterium]